MLRIGPRTSLMACLLAVSGCGKESLVSATLVAGQPIAIDMLTVEVSDGRRTWIWAADDFSTGQDRPLPTTDEVQTASSGILDIRFRLESGGRLLSSGSAQIPLQDDWRWAVQFHASTDDPRCFGCFGARAFALDSMLRSPGRDSLWIVWGGNSISNPVIY